MTFPSEMSARKSGHGAFIKAHASPIYFCISGVVFLVVVYLVVSNHYRMKADVNGKAHIEIEPAR